MLAVERLPTINFAMPGFHFKPIIEAPMPTKQDSPVDSVFDKEELGPVVFDPAKHLSYREPENILKMTELGFAEDAGVSPVAVSQPFRLFSKEAIAEMRREILSKEVMENCRFSSNIAACQIRGYCPK
jgi:hypothetical protein